MRYSPPRLTYSLRGMEYGLSIYIQGYPDQIRIAADLLLGQAKVSEQAFRIVIDRMDKGLRNAAQISQGRSSSPEKEKDNVEHCSFFCPVFSPTVSAGGSADVGTPYTSGRRMSTPRTGSRPS